MQIKWRLFPYLQLPAKSWHGNHQLQFGTDILHRSFTGSSVSRPINLLEQDGTVDETIAFLGGGKFARRRYGGLGICGGSLVAHQEPGFEFRGPFDVSIERPGCGLRAPRGSGVLHGKQDRSPCRSGFDLWTCPAAGDGFCGLSGANDHELLPGIATSDLHLAKCVSSPRGLPEILRR